MRHFYSLLITLFTVTLGFGQTTVDFDNLVNWNPNTTSYGNYTYTDGTFTATGVDVLRNTTATQDGFPGALGTYSVRLRNNLSTSLTMIVATGGISTFSFEVRRWDDSPATDFSVEITTDNGSSWIPSSTIDATVTDNSDWKTINGSINSGNSNVGVRIVSSGTTERLMVDNFTWTAFSASTAPTGVSTGTAGSITATSAVITNNSVGADGGSEITERGVVYGTAVNPTIAGDKVTSPGTTGSFDVTLTGLDSETTYYARAYATNAVGTTYGDDITFTTLAPAGDLLSDIIIDPVFVYQSNINYTLFVNNDPLTDANSIELAEFIIRDGGASNDSDELSTTLTNLTLSVSNHTNLNKIAIFDGTINVAEVDAAASVDMLGLTLEALDNAVKTFSVRASFNSTVTDNDQIQLTVTAATAQAGASLFATPDAGGAASSIDGDNNRIEVTASDLIFDQDVSDVQVSLVMTPSPTVQAVDGNVNLDLDFTGSVSLAITTGTTTFDATATTSANAVGGIATFNNLIFDVVASGNVLTASATGLTDDSSSSFDVTAAPTFGWQITSTNTDFTIDFDATVAGVNNGQFAGTGFTPTPAVGQLNSDAWESTGMTDGALSYSGSQTSGDYARGTSTGGENDGGFFAFDTGSGNNSLGFQGTSSDFTPGTLTLRAQNQTGVTVTAVDIAYLIYVYNDQQRSNSFNFSYSADDITYTDVSSLDFTSTETADGSPSWVSNSRSTSLNGLSISDGGYLYLRWFSDDVSGSGSRDEFALDDITLSFLTPTTYTYNGSWSPTDPNGSAISIDVIEVLSGSASVTSNLSVNTVSISSGATLTVNPGQSLTTASDLNNSGTLVLNSTSTQYSSLIVNGTTSGDVTYNRYVNDFDAGDPANSNDLVSPLTAIADVNAFLTGNSNLLSQAGTPTLYAFAPFNNNTGVYENLDSDDTGALIADTGTPLFSRGTGFRAASSGPNQTLQFTGTVATTQVDVTITVGSATNGTEAWNLIGNPFPSYIDFAAFFNDNSTVFDTNAQAVYGYNATTSRWTIWNQATIDDTSETEYIAPGQGFFVKSKTGGGTVSFTPAMRTTLGSDDFIADRSANSVSVARADINLESEGKDFNTIIYFNSNATSNLDPGYDAAAYLGNASGIFTHLAEGNTGVELAIQSLAYNDFNEVTIPLGIKSNGGQAMTISLGTNNTLPESVNVYLEDTANGTFTLLNNNSYTVTPESALNGTGRFFLRFTSGTLSIGDDTANSFNIYHDAATQHIVIAGQLSANTQAYVYDLQGRVVSSNALQASQPEQRIDVSSLSSGVYVLDFENGTTRISQKLIIR